MFKKTVIALSLILAGGPLSATIIKIPPAAQVDPAYADIPCSDQQKAYIGELITAMGDQSWAGLFKNRKHLEFIGAQISPVHPLKFLGIIFSNPSLKPKMAAIFDDFLKKGQLVDGLIPNLNREVDKGTLMKHLVPFAKEVGVNPEILKGYFESRDWEAMVRFLIQS